MATKMKISASDPTDFNALHDEALNDPIVREAYMKNRQERVASDIVLLIKILKEL